jgi:hypothetical protein
MTLANYLPRLGLLLRLINDREVRRTLALSLVDDHEPILGVFIFVRIFINRIVIVTFKITVLPIVFFLVSKFRIIFTVL